MSRCDSQGQLGLPVFLSQSCRVVMQKQLLFDTQVKTFQSYLNEQLKKLVMSHAADKSLDKSQPSVKTRPVKTYPGPVQQVNNPGNVIFSSVLPFITDK